MENVTGSFMGLKHACTSSLGLSIGKMLTIRVQIPNRHILAQNLYYSHYYPNHGYYYK